MKWTKIEEGEKLPKESEMLLLVWKTEDRSIVVMGSYSNNLGFIGCDPSYPRNCYRNSYTHWAYVPKPPV